MIEPIPQMKCASLVIVECGAYGNSVCIMQKRNRIASIPFLCDPGGGRTLDPMIKSHLLYQLSYGVRSHNIRSIPRFAVQSYSDFCDSANFFETFLTSLCC